MSYSLESLHRRNNTAGSILPTVQYAELQKKRDKIIKHRVLKREKTLLKNYQNTLGKSKFHESATSLKYKNGPKVHSKRKMKKSFDDENEKSPVKGIYESNFFLKR